MKRAQSMTGYGSGTSESFKVEIRSTNHKNLDIHVNIPYYLYSYEPEIKKIVKKKFNRGRIDIFVPKQELGNIKLKINKSLAAEYYKALMSLKDELSLTDDVGISMLSSQRDIFILDEPEIDISDFYRALETALEGLNITRAEEGKYLSDDISKRIGLIETYISGVDENRTGFKHSAAEKLRERLKEFLGEMQVDETRLIQETAFLIQVSQVLPVRHIGREVMVCIAGFRAPVLVRAQVIEIG